MTTLYGYKRHGEIAFRNHVLVIPSVFCANKVSLDISKNLKNVISIEHAHGCGQIGTDLEQTKRTLIGTALNPNAYGVIIVGLGCEDAAAQELGERIREKTIKPVHIFTIQDIGDTYLAIKKGRNIAKQLLEEAKGLKREPIDFRELSIGFIPNQLEVETRNTSALLMKRLAEELLINQSTVVYGDYNEIISAYKRLLICCRNDAVKEKLNKIVQQTDLKKWNETNMDDFIPENGILTNVVQYAEKIATEDQLVYMHGPNHNLEQLTGLAATGVHLVIIGTANGSIVGSPVVPVLKVSATHELYDAFNEDLDFNAGSLNVEPKLIAPLTMKLFKEVVEILNGKQSKSEEISMTEFGIQRIGPSI